MMAEERPLVEVLSDTSRSLRAGTVDAGVLAVEDALEKGPEPCRSDRVPPDGRRPRPTTSTPSAASRRRGFQVGNIMTRVVPRPKTADLEIDSTEANVISALSTDLRESPTVGGIEGLLQRKGHDSVARTTPNSIG